MESDGWVDNGHPNSSLGLEVELLASELEVLHLLPVHMHLHQKGQPDLGNVTGGVNPCYLTDNCANLRTDTSIFSVVYVTTFPAISMLGQALPKRQATTGQGTQRADGLVSFQAAMKLEAMVGVEASRIPPPSARSCRCLGLACGPPWCTGEPPPLAPAGSRADSGSLCDCMWEFKRSIYTRMGIP